MPRFTLEFTDGSTVNRYDVRSALEINHGAKIIPTNPHHDSITIEVDEEGYEGILQDPTLDIDRRKSGPLEKWNGRGRG